MDVLAAPLQSVPALPETVMLYVPPVPLELRVIVVDVALLVPEKG